METAARRQGDIARNTRKTPDEQKEPKTLEAEVAALDKQMAEATKKLTAEYQYQEVCAGLFAMGKLTAESWKEIFPKDEEKRPKRLKAIEGLRNTLKADVNACSVTSETYPDLLATLPGTLFLAVKLQAQDATLPQPVV